MEATSSDHIATSHCSYHRVLGSTPVSNLRNCRYHDKLFRWVRGGRWVGGGGRCRSGSVGRFKEVCGWNLILQRKHGWNGRAGGDSLKNSGSRQIDRRRASMWFRCGSRHEFSNCADGDFGDAKTIGTSDFWVLLRLLGSINESIIRGMRATIKWTS